MEDHNANNPTGTAAAAVPAAVPAPLTPDSIPALLAEEWTIRPHSALPSFLEVMMVQDAEHAVTKAIKAAVDSIRNQLLLLLLRHRRSLGLQQLSTTTTTTPTTSSSSSSAMLQRTAKQMRIALQVWILRLAAALERVLDKYGAEICCLIRYGLERRFLQSSSSSTLAESLYGMLRVKAINMNSASPDIGSSSKPVLVRKLVPLQRSDQTRLALMIAFGPYYQERLQDLHARWRSRNQTQQQQHQQHCQRHFHSVMIHVATCSRLLLQASNVYCQWRYLLGASHFTDLRNVLLGQVVRRVTQQDAVAAGSATTTTTRQHNDAPTGTMKSSSRTQSTSVAAKETNDTQQPAAGTTTTDGRLPSLVQSSVPYLVAASIAFSWATQVRAWYQERHRQQQQHQQQLLFQQQQQSVTRPSAPGRHLDERQPGIIPPPLLPYNDTTTKGIFIPNGCALCGRRECSNPTACATSGHVFCLSCILPFVRQHGTCPGTGASVKESQLVRLFEPAEMM